MSEQQKHFPEFYVTAPQPCPYLPGRLERKLFTHLTPRQAAGARRQPAEGRLPAQPEHRLHALLRGLPGLRLGARAGRRVRADALLPPRRSSANRDLVARRLAPRPTSEQYSLFRDYIDARHADGGMADMTVLDYAMMVEDSIIDTFVTEYRVQPDRRARHRRRRAGRWPRVAVRPALGRHLDGLQLLRVEQRPTRRSAPT